MDRFVIVDSREKPKAIKGTLAYLEKHEIPYTVSKLLFGDYMDYNRPGLAKNCTSEHERFRRELERTKMAGGELVILVEQNRYKDREKWIEVNSIEDMIFWTSPRTVVTGEKVFRVLKSWCAKYPLRVEFCDKRSTGRRIVEILYEEDEE